MDLPDMLRDSGARARCSASSTTARRLGTLGCLAQIFSLWSHNKIGALVLREAGVDHAGGGGVGVDGGSSPFSLEVMTVASTKRNTPRQYFNLFPNTGRIWERQQCEERKRQGVMQVTGGLSFWSKKDVEKNAVGCHLISVGIGSSQPIYNLTLTRTTTAPIVFTHVSDMGSFFCENE